MEFIFSKKQIDLLRENDDNDDIFVRDDGNSTDVGQEATEALQKHPQAGGVTMNASTFQNDNQASANLVLQGKNPQTAINQNKNLIDQYANSDAGKNGGTVTFEKDKQHESVVKYSKKELNKFLFK